MIHELVFPEPKKTKNTKLEKNIMSTRKTYLKTQAEAVYLKVTKFECYHC